MLNITSQYRKTNQKHNEVSPHTGQNGDHQKKNLQTINARNDVEKREPSYTVGWNKIGSML